MNEQDEGSRRAGETPGRQSGSWFVRVGMGWWLLGAALWVMILFPVFVRARDVGGPHTCRNHLGNLMAALQMYAQDYDDRLPPATEWQSNLSHYLRNQSRDWCPNRRDVTPGYAYNVLLDRRQITKSIQDDKIPAFFDSSLGQKDAADCLQSFVRPHGSPELRKGNVVFLDGHVEARVIAPSASAGLTSVARERPAAGGKR